MSTTSDPDRARPRASRGQVVTAGAAIVTAVAAIVAAAAVAAAAVVWLAAFQTVVLKSLGETGTGFDQDVKELVCVPYANAVLDLSKQGYSADAIADVYRNAAKPAAGEAPRDPGAPRGPGPSTTAAARSRFWPQPRPRRSDSRRLAPLAVSEVARTDVGNRLSCDASC